MITLLLSKLFAILFLTIGLTMIINPKQFKKSIEDLLKHDGVLFFAGLFTIYIGAFIIAYHSKWNTSWERVISTIGYIALLKGFFYITFPKYIKRAAKTEFKNLKSIRLIGFLCLAFAALFFYKAFLCGCEI